uniref:EF-hand domain-containing protein n=1 Tax=Haptolina ericina TaxID=156174 RepID=A0A7S3B9X9_9EUKA|mmetsp:Transcript_54478/g.121976  ORF Transcript_54478/g.121976 Transcript_54478/m.121976 type:complete len:199 (+) Transcript_54478:1-597(+)
MQFLQAIFAAADVDQNGQLTFDEFSEMVRRTVPTLSNDQVAAMFVEAIKSSSTRDAIQPDAFARVALRYGMLRGNGHPGAPPDMMEGDKKQMLAESLKVVSEMWQVLVSKGEEQQFSDLLQARAVDMDALIATKPLTKAVVEQAWSLYRSVSADLNRFAFESKEGGYDEFGVVIDADTQKATSASGLYSQSSTGARKS